MNALHIVAGFIFGALVAHAIWTGAEYIHHHHGRTHR